jgi:DNA replication protein DnaC
MSAGTDVCPALIGHLKDLRLPTVRGCYEETARRAERETLSYEQYLLEVISRECEQRRKSRVQRLLKDSELPLEKSLQNFDVKRLPAKATRQMRTLLEGGFLDRKENVLVFGNPGSGKSHLLTALAQELVVVRERKMHFTKCALLMQDLLAAKRDLRLSREIKRLGRYDGLIIDDLGYLQQSRDDMEVVFTLLAERYERGSVLMTSNLPFSKWEAIFKDAMMTAAAIDRLVHHSVIIELNIPSYRVEPRVREADRREATAQNRKGRELWKCRGCGKRGKPKTGFPLFPRAPWKSRQKAARFPHFHSSGDEGGWKSGKPKAGFPLSHRPECIWRSSRKTEPRAGFALRPAAGAPRRLRVKR